MNQPTPADLTASLVILKLLVRGMDGALGASLTAQLRHEACERLDRLIIEVGGMAR